MIPCGAGGYEREGAYFVGCGEGTYSGEKDGDRDKAMRIGFLGRRIFFSVV